MSGRPPAGLTPVRRKVPLDRGAAQGKDAKTLRHHGEVRTRSRLNATTPKHPGKRSQPKTGEDRRKPAKTGGPSGHHYTEPMGRNRDKSAKKWTKMHAPERPQSTSRIVNAVRNRSWPTGTLRLQRPDPDQKKHGETRRNTVKHGGRNRVAPPKRVFAGVAYASCFAPTDPYTQ